MKKNFKSSLIYDLINLTESVNNLNNYLYSNEDTLKDKEKELLSEQVKYMYAYRDTLIERINYYMNVGE